MSDKLKPSKYPILDEIEVPKKVFENWQVTLDLLAEMAGVPSALIMRVHKNDIEVFVANHNHDNVYHPGEKASLDTGLYCETVLSTQKKLLVPNALKDPDWDHNPDIKHGMIAYCGLPLTWPTGELFGTFCILDKKENVFIHRIQTIMERFRDSIQLGLESLYEMSLVRSQRNDAQNALHESEQRSQRYLDTTQTMMVALDKTGAVTMLNRSGQLFLGYTEAELIGRNWFATCLPQPEGMDIVFPVFQRIMTGELEDFLEYENTVQCRNGRRRLIRWRNNYFRDDEGRITGTLSSGEDITERKQVEKKLEQERKRMDVILSSLNTGLSLINPDMTIAWTNQKVREMFPGREPVGQVCHVFYESRTTICDGCGTLQAFMNGKVCESEQLVPATGRWYNILSQPIKDKTGRVVNVLEGITDITERKQVEKTLHDRDQRIRLATEASGVGIWEWNIKTNRVRWDKQMFDIYGIIPTEDGFVEYSDWSGSVLPEELLMQESMLQETIMQRGRGIREFHIKRRNDGQMRTIQAIETVLTDANGDVQWILGTNLDITERKQAESKILKINRLYATISQINQTIVRTKDRDTIFKEVCRIAIDYGKFQMAWIGLVNEENGLVEPITFSGVEEEYLTKIKNISVSDTFEGRGPTGTAVKEERYFVCNDIANNPVMAPWKDEALKRGYRSSIALPIKLFGNVIGAFNLYAPTPDFFDQDEIEMLIEIENDISFALDTIESEKKRKAAEEKLIQSEERFRTMFNRMPDGIYRSTPEGKFVEINPAFVKMLGYSDKEEMMGIDIAKELYFSPEERERLVSTAGNDEYNIFLMRKKDGSPIWVEDHGSYIHDDKGNILFHEGIIRDVTERKRVEQELLIAKKRAEESDELKTSFINNISHEIRTPLNSILGFGRFLTESELSAAERKEYFEYIDHSSKRLMNTVTDYMDMAMIASNSMKVYKKEFELKPLFESITEKIGQLCAYKKINFEVEVPVESENITVDSDPEFIQKILDKLIDNAVKFTKEGSITCGYVIKTGLIEFFVKDTGCGIDNNKLELIFEMFSQEDSSSTRGYEGSGLGLSIAKGYVTLLGGQIHVTSEKGKGSVFSFTIPLKNSGRPISPVKVDATRPKSTNKPLILIAEDDELNYLYIEALIKSLDYEIIHVVNGEEAVYQCRQNPEISVVLMDIKMPVMNGVEATKQIREFRPQLPIIATTAYAQTGDEHRFLEAGCNDYIAKPIKRDELLSLISKYAE